LSFFRTALCSKELPLHSNLKAATHMIQTKRLILRQWDDADLQPFAEMCGDSEVMEFFPQLLTEVESYSLANRMRSLIADRGWGFWAVEVPDQARFIGYVGLHIPRASMPFHPCVEVGWRLAKEYWGRGYATEAARASLDYAFAHLDLKEVVSFTTTRNLRSQAVMKKIGMTFDRHFMHPELDVSSPLREHVLYKVSAAQHLG